MTSKVVFRRAARAEFERAALWYEQRQAGLGMQFTTEIDRAIQLAAKRPQSKSSYANTCGACCRSDCSETY